ncbi:MAG: hypothetical protein ACI86C_001609 [Candidatus Latescibacterota bacterium]|jgi:hypothetical protein
MRKILTLVCIFTYFIGSAQETEPKISINYNEASIAEVLSLIEEKSNYNFYYVPDWLESDPVTGSYEDTAVSVVLNSVLKNTILNFYVLEGNKVILTRNNIIYDTLPEGFFNDKSAAIVLDEEETKTNPLFVKEEKSNQNTRIQTVRIGKENRANTRKSFTLSGIAINPNTGESIADLAIAVRGKNLGTTTDLDGRYSIDLPAGLNLIETNSLGNVDVQKKVIIYNDGILNFNLEEDLQTLGVIVLEASRGKNVKQAITGVTQIKVEEIKTIPLVLGERDILKVATILPGISTAGEGASGYNVRGGKTDQNLILLDEAVIYNPSHFFGIFSALNPFTSGEVNIYKGSMPAEFGGRLSSVFDIKTKDANVEKFAGEVSLGPVTSNVTLEVPLVKGKSAFLVGGRTTYSDLILQQLDEPELAKSKANFFDIIAKYNSKLGENDDLKATAYFSRDAFSITSDSLYSYSNRLGSLRWNHTFNDKNRGSVILAHSQYKFNIDYDGQTNQNFKLGYKVAETELKIKMKYLMSDAHKFDYGVSAKTYKVNPGTINPTASESIIKAVDIAEEQALEAAVFMSDTWEINDKLLVNAGIRYSYFASKGPSEQNIYQDGLPLNSGTLLETKSFGSGETIQNYGGPEIRVSARYILGQDFSIKAGYNNSYQFIHTLSNNTTVSPTDTWKLSDLNIKPQEQKQYSLGLFKNLDDDIYELSLEGYYKESDNILDYKVGAQLLLNEEIETEVLQGKGKAYGVELLLKKSKGKLNGWIGYTYSRSLIQLDSEFAEERVNGGEFFPSNFDKPHDFSLVTNYKMTKRFSWSMNFVYQTGRPVTYPIGSYELNGSEYVFYSDRNKFRIPDYYRLDLSLNIEGNHKIKKFAHSFWNISVYNVLGRNNPYSVFFVTQEGEVKAFQSSIFSVPIPTITYNFKF